MLENIEKATSNISLPYCNERKIYLIAYCFYILFCLSSAGGQLADTSVPLFNAAPQPSTPENKMSADSDLDVLDLELREEGYQVPVHSIADSLDLQ